MMLEASKNRDQTKKSKKEKRKEKDAGLVVFLVLLLQLQLSIFKRNRCVFLGRNGGIWSEHASGFVAFPGVIPGRQVALSAQWRGSGDSGAPQPDFNLFFMWYIHTAHNAFCTTSFISFICIRPLMFLYISICTRLYLKLLYSLVASCLHFTAHLLWAKMQ